MRKVIELYFDSYEAKFGDGFYPLTHKDASCDSTIQIEFEYYDGELFQLTGPQIKGYDGNTYNEIIRAMVT